MQNRQGPPPFRPILFLSLSSCFSFLPLLLLLLVLSFRHPSLSPSSSYPSHIGNESAVWSELLQDFKNNASVQNYCDFPELLHGWGVIASLGDYCKFGEPLQIWRIIVSSRIGLSSLFQTFGSTPLSRILASVEN